MQMIKKKIKLAVKFKFQEKEVYLINNNVKIKEE